jgi:hypothetical protein
MLGIAPGVFPGSTLCVRASEAASRRRSLGPGPRGRSGTLARGGVSERPKEHASKACEVQASQGSNPCATASRPRTIAILMSTDRGVRRVVSVCTPSGRRAQRGGHRADPRNPRSHRPQFPAGDRRCGDDHHQRTQGTGGSVRRNGARHTGQRRRFLATAANSRRPQPTPGGPCVASCAPVGQESTAEVIRSAHASHACAGGCTLPPRPGAASPGRIPTAFCSGASLPAHRWGRSQLLR